MKQLGDILLEGGHVTREQLGDRGRRAAPPGPQPRPGAGRHGHADRGPARRRARDPDRAEVRRPVRTTPSTAPPSPASPRRSAAATPLCRSATRTASCVVAMADPANVFAVDDIRSMTGLEVKSVVATKADVMAAIDRYHRGDDEMDELTSAIDVTHDGRRRPLQRHRDRRGRADRQVRQPAHHAGDPGPRVRHPHRARREGPARPVPHRRRAARGHALAEVHHLRRHQPPEDHGRHQHRRAPHPAGRPAVGEHQRQEDRPARGDAARRCGARRSSCASWTTPPRC